jgi:hypothetical protein
MESEIRGLCSTHEKMRVHETVYSRAILIEETTIELHIQGRVILIEETTTEVRINGG